MKTVTLKGRFTTDLLDTATAETTPLKGKVILQAQYKALLASESGDPTTVIPSLIEIELGSEGRLPPTEILATDDPATTPQGWTWLVSFKLTTLDNRPVNYAPFNFHAPAEQIIDLTTVAPVTSCNGVAISRGNDGVSPVDFTVSGTNLNIRLSDGSTQTVALPVLDPTNTTVINGKDGRGITSVTQSGTTLTVNYDDGTTSEPITIPTVAGERGPEGSSAYQVALQQGFVGSETQWLATLKGPKGDTGAASTVAGPPGEKGTDGLSAYQVAVSQGFQGTEAQWLESLKGEAGKDAVAPAYDDTALTNRVTAVETDKLSKTDAANTYATKTELENKLDSTTAATTYATKAEMPKMVISATEPVNPVAGLIWYKPVV